MNTFDKQRRRMRLGLASVFGLLTLAAAYLIYFSYGQLRYEAFFEQRNLAEAFVNRVGVTLSNYVSREAGRAPTEYEFLLGGDARYNQLSPLSTLSPDSGLPGTLGYFQVDASGQFSTPLLPEAVDELERVGFSVGEIEARREAQRNLRQVLAKNQLEDTKKDTDDALGARLEAQETATGLTASRERTVAANQQIFSDLSQTEPGKESADYVSRVGRVDELKLKVSQAAAKAASEPERDANLQSAPVPAPAVASSAPATKPTQDAEKRAIDAAPAREITLTEAQRLDVFEDSVNPFRLTVLDSEHVAFHRDVFLQGERRIQGFVVALNEFFSEVVAKQYATDRVSATNDLAIALGSEVAMLLPALNRAQYSIATADVVGNELVLRRYLPAPAQEFELIVSTQALPSGAGIGVLVFAGTLLLLLIVVGYFAINYLTRRSIDLAQQQQDFVSAVTHELKTPLTSIRMYGEILRAGWAGEEKKQSYYDFIFHESERLSRLIGNVLQLARITRGSEETMTLQSHSVASLIERVRAATEGQFENSGFVLESSIDDEVDALRVSVDPDGFQQVMVNLLDNALKFARDSEPRKVVIGARKHRDAVDFFVRDFGPGIPRAKLKKIFELFYRGEDELTRETAGTGIGLALVAELVDDMHGEIDVISQTPGSEFVVRLPQCE